MTKQESIKTLIWGAVGGAVLTVAIGFGSGWLVSGGTRDKEVAMAWIDAQASVCSSLVHEHRQMMGDASDLSGYNARSARDDLAKANAIVLTGSEAADPAVVRACAKLLDKKNT